METGHDKGQTEGDQADSLAQPGDGDAAATSSNTASLDTLESGVEERLAQASLPPDYGVSPPAFDPVTKLPLSVLGEAALDY